MGAEPGPGRRSGSSAAIAPHASNPTSAIRMAIQAKRRHRVSAVAPVRKSRGSFMSSASVLGSTITSMVLLLTKNNLLIHGDVPFQGHPVRVPKSRSYIGLRLPQVQIGALALYV